MLLGGAEARKFLHNVGGCLVALRRETLDNLDTAYGTILSHFELEDYDTLKFLLESDSGVLEVFGYVCEEG